jgi:hypothetical protein
MTLNHNNCSFLVEVLIFNTWKFIFSEKKKKRAFERTKIEFFVLTKRSLLTDFSRVLVIWRIFDTWLQIISSSQIFFTADSFLTVDFFLIADFFLITNYFALNDFYQSFFVLNASVKTIVENKSICLLQMTLLNNEFEELVCCSKKICLCKKTRDKYWISNSTYNYFY